MKHDELVDAAETAIDRLFSDTSVGPETTRESLEGLKNTIDIKLECLDVDSRKQDSSPSTRRVRSFDQARVATSQHKKPCGDCPFARTAANGWLGNLTVDEWITCAHGESLVECHTLTGAQCAGAAIYRANNCKAPRDQSILRLPADRGLVFANRVEFAEHHSKLLETARDVEYHVQFEAQETS